jgi:hypothetical protein
VAAAVLVLGGLAAVLFASGGGEGSTSEPPAVEAQALVKLTALDAGECLMDPASYTSQGSYWHTTAFWPQTVRVVPCDEPHTAETFFVADIWAQDADNPGEGAMAEQARSRCEDEFEAYVGTPYADSDLYFGYWNPDSATWRVGDRQVGCIAYYEDGRELVRSVEGLRQ